MDVVKIIASIAGLVIFAAIGIYAIPYILAFSGFVLAIIVICALAQAAWKLLRGNTN